MSAGFIQYLPYIVEGAYWTFALVCGGLALGFLIGLPIAVGQVYGGKTVRTILNVYVWFFRGVPLIVLLFLFFWGIFPAIGLKLSALTTSIIVLGFRSGAYQSQIFRGAIESVGEGQVVAAKSIGMSELQSIIHVVLPQALRIAIPSWTNEYAILLKDSAICFTLGVMEILTRTKYVTVSTGIYFLPYVFAGILYIILTYAGTKVFNIVYEKLRIPGFIEGEM